MPSIKQVLDALRELTIPPDLPKRPIGFAPSENKGKKPLSRRGGARSKG